MRFDCFRNLIGYEESLIDWNTASGDPICQRRAVNQFHDQRGDTVRLLETVDVASCCGVYEMASRSKALGRAFAPWNLRTVEPPNLRTLEP